MKIGLEHLAVLFKCDNEIPFRAALKAKSLKCMLVNADGSASDLCFFELSDVAATASFACEKSVFAVLRTPQSARF